MRYRMRALLLRSLHHLDLRVAGAQDGAGGGGFPQGQLGEAGQFGASRRQIQTTMFSLVGILDRVVEVRWSSLSTIAVRTIRASSSKSTTMPVAGPLGLQRTGDGDVEPVRMAVQPRALSVVVRQHVRGFERELFADPHDMRFSVSRRTRPSMIATNRNRLVDMPVHGEVAAPSVPGAIYDVGHDGVARVLPSVGGISLNVRVGDGAFAFVGDHIEPGVSTRHPDDKVNVGYCVYACVGNPADGAQRRGQGRARHGHRQARRHRARDDRLSAGGDGADGARRQDRDALGRLGAGTRRCRRRPRVQLRSGSARETGRHARGGKFESRSPASCRRRSWVRVSAARPSRAATTTSSASIR